MTEKQLHAKIDKASEEDVRDCLKEIASLWFVQSGKASFYKPIDGDVIMSVTTYLHAHDFCPKE